MLREIRDASRNWRKRSVSGIAQAACSPQFQPARRMGMMGRADGMPAMRGRVRSRVRQFEAAKVKTPATEIRFRTLQQAALCGGMDEEIRADRKPGRGSGVLFGTQ